MRGVASALLSMEAIVLLLVVPVAISVVGVDAAVALPVGVGLAVLCFLAIGGLGRGWGYPLGWAIQAIAVALGVVVAPMYFLGAVFGLLWFLALRLGRQVEQAQRKDPPAAA
jgi:hypothetical protein